MVTLLLIIALTAAVYIAQNKLGQEVIEEAGSSVHADHSSEYLVYKDEMYPVKNRLSTVLLIGTDNFIADADQIIEGKNRNRDLADFLVLLVIDHNAKTVSPLQFNRDTICDVPWLDERGYVGGYRQEHLTYAHSYGSGKEDSCINTVKAVRRLIFNAPIESYLAFTMDAVPIINDLVGGVTVKLEDSLPDLGAEYVKGASLKLDGSASLRFIRYRENTGGSNWFRMQRQRLYLDAFMEAARTGLYQDSELTLKAIDKINPYLTTNMTVNSLSAFVEYLNDYTFEDTFTPTGDIVPGKEYYEFYVHEDSLWSSVHKIYCVEEAGTAD